MFETMQLTQSGYVRCDVCFKELPRSEAECVKARVYEAHVCGPECYDEWEQEEMRERTREAGEP